MAVNKYLCVFCGEHFEAPDIYAARDLDMTCRLCRPYVSVLPPSVTDLVRQQAIRITALEQTIETLKMVNRAV